MTRKTKRNSPPPLQTTIDTLDYGPVNKFSEKVSKVLQLITPPNKKRRAIALIGQSQTYDEESDSSSDEEPDKETLLKQKKLLNRRAVYIESPPTIEIQAINDGPQGTRQKWTMYCKTMEKLRRNSLPLTESMQLRTMLVKLQKDEFIQQKMMCIQKEQRQRLNQLDEDDNTPLGTLFNSQNVKRISPPPFYQMQPLFYQQQRWMPSSYYCYY